MPIGLSIAPLMRKEGRDFVVANHRHHGWPVGYLWLHGLRDQGGSLVGCAVVGRPVSRELQDGYTMEVTRLCTDGSRNACSMLYGAARRAALAKGYRRGITYILASESGASLRASGWRKLWRVPGRSWNCRSRPRIDHHPTEDKIAYGFGAFD